MARPLRIEYDGALYHITARGNERKVIYQDDEDRAVFLNIILGTNKRYNWICHAYCLMKNHYHLLVETPDGNLSKGMRQLNGVYTQVYNQRHRRNGHLLQGRYKAMLIEKDSYLLAVGRYIVLNPVRARIVTDPEQWKWGSYRATAGFEKPAPCLTTDWILSQFGNRRDKATAGYRKFVNEGIGEESVLKKAKGQVILGAEEFIKKVMAQLNRKGLEEIPRAQRFLDRPILTDLFKNLKTEKTKRNKKIAEAILAHGYGQKEIAAFLGMHYSTISRIVKSEETSKFKT